ncbi:MAG: hypothetical protein ACRDRV_16630 [Pseudonocardiaceae bacterium]
MPTSDRPQGRRPAPDQLVPHGRASVPAHRVRAVQRMPPQPARLSRDALAHLQHAAGNRAVSGLLDHHRATSTVVQRAIENESFREDIGVEEKANVQAFFTAFDAAVDAAYKYVISVPSLGAWVKLNGYTKLWGEKWADFLGGGRPKLMAAAFGYVIESLVSGDTDFRPGPPPGCTVFTQVTSGGTRPDLVLRLKKGGHDLAWLDLTASGSVDHIYDKEGWGKKVGNFAEVTYPSLDPGALAFMVQNKDNTGALSQEDFEKRQKAAREAYEQHKSHWAAMGKEKYSVKANKRAIATLGRMNLEIKPGLKRGLIKAKLETGFGTKIDDEKMIPSILSAMRVSPRSWAFDTGYSESERAGEAWLLDNDPTLPSSGEPETGPEAGGERSPAGGRVKTQRPKVRGGDPY